MTLKSTLAAAAVALCALSAAGAASATAVPDTYETYTFFGTCADCTGYGTATLDLVDYTAGSALDPSNFVSFEYSSNLISYTITDAFELEGSIEPAPGQYDVGISGMGYGTGPTEFYTFDSSTDGSWQTGNLYPADKGPQSIWNPASGVPEPAGWALGIAGMASIGVMLRRSRRQPVAA